MNTVKILVALLIILNLMNSCTPKNSADLIVTNAKVYLIDDRFSIAESFAVVDGKIAATGTTEEILKKYSSENIVDATGKYVYPGFNDAHCHFNGYANNLAQYADLRGTKSPDEVYERLTTHHEKFGGNWILGRSWDQNDWEVKEFPDKTKLDELFPNIPVYLVRVDGHAGWCNSKALEMAGISAATKVQGGEVVLKNGQPTGVLVDNTMGLVAKLIPEISAEQQQKALLEAQANCFAAGLTSVTDCGLDKSTILLVQEMQNRSELKMRVNAMLNPTKENFEYFVKKDR
jgi:predicted amidohydrolase YtcJ